MTDTTKTEALRLADALSLSHANHGLHHKAAYELRRLSAVEAERDHYKARCEALTDDALSRVMDASEDELNAALKLEGKDPDDTARLAGQAMELALLTAERDRLAAECEALRDVMQQTYDALKGLKAAKQRLEDLGPFTVRYVLESAQFKLLDAGKAVDSMLDVIDAAMGGKE